MVALTPPSLSNEPKSILGCPTSFRVAQVSSSDNFTHLIVHCIVPLFPENSIYGPDWCILDKPLYMCIEVISYLHGQQIMMIEQAENKAAI